MVPVSPATKGKWGLQLELSIKLSSPGQSQGQLRSVLVLKNSQVQQHMSKVAMASEYYLLKGQLCALHQLQNMSAIYQVNFMSLIMFADSMQRKKKQNTILKTVLGEIKRRHKLQGENICLKQDEQLLSDIYLGTTVSC